MENCQELVVGTARTPATGYAERLGVLDMFGDLPGGHHAMLDAKKAYDTHGFVEALRGAQRHPARGAEFHAPRRLGARRAHEPPSGQRREPTHPKARRGGVRLG